MERTSFGRMTARINSADWTGREMLPSERLLELLKQAQAQLDAQPEKEPANG